jgi:F-type H+-transporting ATPase subunit b
MMLALIMTLAMLQSVEEHSTPWWNIPGLELWKFLNLAIFVSVLVYFLRKPISEGLKARREGIKRELDRARLERDAALIKLKEVEAKLSALDQEIESIRISAEREAEEEKERIRKQAEEDARKLREQVQREIESASKAAKQDLTRHAARESVRLAEQMIRLDLTAEDDLRLIAVEVEELGGLRK